MYPFGGFPDSSVGKESACNVGDSGLITGSGRSPGQGKGYPLQDSGLKNSMISGVHGVPNSQTGLSNCHFGGLVWLMGKTTCVRARGKYIWKFSSVTHSCSTLCDTLDCSTRLPCPSPTPGACSSSCPLSRWCHTTSHPLSSPSPPAFSLSQHQCLP